MLSRAAKQVFQLSGKKSLRNRQKKSTFLFLLKGGFKAHGVIICSSHNWWRFYIRVSSLVSSVRITSFSLPRRAHALLLVAREVAAVLFVQANPEVGELVFNVLKVR